MGEQDKNVEMETEGEQEEVEIVENRWNQYKKDSKKLRIQMNKNNDKETNLQLMIVMKKMAENMKDNKKQINIGRKHVIFEREGRELKLKKGIKKTLGENIKQDNGNENRGYLRRQMEK